MEAKILNNETILKIKELQRQNDYLRKRNKTLSFKYGSTERLNKSFFWRVCAHRFICDEIENKINEGLTPANIAKIKDLLDEMKTSVDITPHLRTRIEHIKYDIAIEVAKELKIQSLELEFRDSETDELKQLRTIFYAEN